MSHSAIDYIVHYGYMAIFILVFLQEIGVPNPVPNELVLMFSGYLTFTGALSLIFVLLSAIIADVLGASILYIVFYFFGAYVLNHKPSWLPIPEKKIDALSVKLSAGQGLLPFFFGRITPFIRGYVSVIAGLLRIKPNWYLPIIIVTGILVSSAYVIAGRLLGPYWSSVAIEFLKIKYVLLTAALLALLYILFKRYNLIGTHKADYEKEPAEIVFNENFTVHMVSETAYVTKGQGVHTAFLGLIALLRERNDVKVVVNNEGTGDIFHSHTYGPYYFWKGRNYKGKRIHTVHVIPDSIKGSLLMWKQLFPLAKIYFRIVFSYADVLIALSPMVEDAILALGVKTPIVKIYNPISFEQWRSTAANRKKGRELLGLKDDDTVVLGVGQLQERKGVEDFIDIGEAIPGAKFVWIGGRPFGIFTEGINRINERIEKASPHIHFAGMYDLADMPAIYAAADIFLFPSYQENCPLAPIEAAACGLPVIYRDLKEYALLYKSDYLNAASTNEFIKLSERLIADANFYREAKLMSEKLVEQFDKDVIRIKMMELYQHVLKGDFNKPN
jgi:1,2-diacylglycerol-3-alpha-glucose alpha-1,2-galactosyltransferase